MKTNYDYIFTGAGCAGLSLMMRLIESGHLNTKKVLIIDKSPKTANDRTWCFWEKKAGFFESLVHHSWTNLSVYGSLDKETKHESSKHGSSKHVASRHEATKHEATKHEATKHEASKHGASKFIVSNDEGRNDEGRNDDGRNDEGRNDEGRNNEGRNDEGRNDEGRNDEGRNDEGRNDEGRNNKGTNNKGTNYAETFAIAPYQYKMIRGIDFYNHCLSQIKANQNITILSDEVLETGNINESAFAKTTTGTYTANYVFNSIPPKELLQKIAPESHPTLTTKSLNHSTHHSPLTTHHFSHATHHFLLQHFKGFIIKSPTPAFDPSTGTLMDFRVSQQHGTSFVYVLPLSKYEALVEFTLFTGQLLQQETYDQVVDEYIKQILKIDSYEVVSSEYGVIPMTDFPFPPNNGRVINIGTAGGQTKPSTGYTFVFIQKQADSIASLLAAGKFPVAKNSFSKRKFHWYDSILLRVLATGKLPGAFIFTELFRKNKATDVFRFLDNESNIFQDLKVIKAPPALIFAGAAIQQATKPPGSPVLHT